MANRQVQDALELIDLNINKKKIITFRVKGLLSEYRSRSFKYSMAYSILRIIITVGSLIVPALLSVQYTNGSSVGQGGSDYQVYWSVWVLSLFVTISNGVVTLFKVDKKYFVLNTTYQHIISESWQYIQLSGKYSGFYTPNEDSTHDNQYKFFCHVLEKIRMKQVEDEYYKITDTPSHQQQTSDSLIPPTPMKVVISDSVTEEKPSPELNGPTTIRRHIKEELAPIKKNIQTPNQEQGKLTKISFKDESVYGEMPVLGQLPD